MSRPAIATDEIKVQVVTNEVVSLLYFAESLIGISSRSPYLRERYQADMVLNPPKVRPAVDPSAGIKQAFDAMPPSIKFFENPTRAHAINRYYGRNMTDVLEIMAINARDLEDFGKRCYGLMPPAVHDVFMQSLRALSPIHKRLIWQPSQGFLNRAKRDLIALSKKTQLPKLLRQITQFYASVWPPAQPITIALVPIPKKNRSGTTTYAHSIEAYEVVEVLEQDEMAGRFGVLIHELCHSFYSAQSMQLQDQIDRWFVGSKNPVATPAYNWIDEALATAIGNGHIELQLKGPGVHKEGWYADPIIDGYAKAIYPVVASYIASGKRFDEALVQQFIAAFAKRFPHAATSPSVLFTKLMVTAGVDINAREVYAVLREKFRIQSSSVSTPLDHPKTIDNFVGDPNHTVIFVLTPENQSRMRVYPFFKTIESKIKSAFSLNRDFLYFFRAEARAIIILGVTKPTHAISAIHELAKQRHLIPEKILSL